MKGEIEKNKLLWKCKEFGWSSNIGGDSEIDKNINNRKNEIEKILSENSLTKCDLDFGAFKIVTEEINSN